MKDINRSQIKYLMPYPNTYESPFESWINFWGDTIIPRVLYKDIILFPALAIIHNLRKWQPSLNHNTYANVISSYLVILQIQSTFKKLIANHLSCFIHNQMLIIRRYKWFGFYCCLLVF